ncbi:MAG: HNH endonuclease [Brevundimonas sp.]|uniref:HNH endonuclease n=1 Tax=Brevundimonas sp. TaxID=1871086 RepID=UPI00391C982D
MSLNGERLLAHRWVCEQINGPPPSTVHHAAHSCGVRSCVNPHHLRWATPSENCMDRAKHGTSGKGKPGPRRVLTEAQVKRIRRLGPSMSQRQIADLVGTSQGHVGRILRGELWGWLDRRREYGEGGAGPDEDGRAG